MDFTTALDELNIILGDSDDFTFTPEEKTRALTEAWRDRYVALPANATNTYSVNSRTYTFTGLNTIKNIEYNTADAWGRQLPGSAYTLENGVVYIDYDFRYSIPDGATLTAFGYSHPDTATSLSGDNVIEYVLAVAQYNTLKLLGAKKTNKFLKNDTTMADIINQRRELERDILVKRQALQRSYERS